MSCRNYFVIPNVNKYLGEPSAKRVHSRKKDVLAKMLFCFGANGQQITQINSVCFKVVFAMKHVPFNGKIEGTTGYKEVQVR